MKLSTLEVFLKKARELDMCGDTEVRFGGYQSNVDHITMVGKQHNLHLYRVTKGPDGKGVPGYELIKEEKQFFETEGDLK